MHSTSLVSALVMVDLRQSGAVMQEYRLDKGAGTGGVRRRSGSCVSPCGDLVLAGDRGGAVTVWDTDTGASRHVYERPMGAEQNNISSIQSVCFHPHDHVVVFGALPSGDRSRDSGFGRKGPPAVVYKFKKEGTAEE